MTLAEVAARVRLIVVGFRGVVDSREAARIENIVKMFEADPEFKMPEQVDNLAREMECESSLLLYPLYVARRLHEMRGTKLVLPPDFQHTLGFSFGQPIVCPCGVAHGNVMP